VVTNLSYESKEDDVKMLMEGYGRIACIRCNGGAATGLGRITALHHRSPAPYQIRSHIRCL
jgi:hypothetical protein